MTRTISTLQELEELPHRSIVMTVHGVYLRDKPRLFPDKWCWLKPGSSEAYPRINPAGHATVLYEPEEIS